MKYAYIIGSNAFIVPNRVVSCNDDGSGTEFLRINSIYHDLPPTAEQSFLDIDLDISDTDGNRIILIANKPANALTYTLETERDSIKILKPDGSLVVHVHQLDDGTALGLEHNIAAELEAHAPIAAIRITGEFMVCGLHVRAENEKLFINENGYGNSVLAGKNQLKFTQKGVEL